MHRPQRASASSSDAILRDDGVYKHASQTPYFAGDPIFFTPPEIETDPFLGVKVSVNVGVKKVNPLHTAV